jgi:hypothetical protein
MRGCENLFWLSTGRIVSLYLAPILLRQPTGAAAKTPLERMNMRTDLQPMNGRASGLVDVLDRVLDKGLVVAGDIKISLAEVELLTIRIRLIVCSIDKAEQIGLDWWRYDTHLAPGRDRLAVENQSLKKQIRSLERRVAALASKPRGRAPRTE